LAWRWFTGTETCCQLCINDYIHAVSDRINYFIILYNTTRCVLSKHSTTPPFAFQNWRAIKLLHSLISSLERNDIFWDVSRNYFRKEYFARNCTNYFLLRDVLNTRTNTNVTLWPSADVIKKILHEYMLDTNI